MVRAQSKNRKQNILNLVNADDLLQEGLKSTGKHNEIGKEGLRSPAPALDGLSLGEKSRPRTLGVTEESGEGPVSLDVKVYLGAMKISRSKERQNYAKTPTPALLKRDVFFRELHGAMSERTERAEDPRDYEYPRSQDCYSRTTFWRNHVTTKVEKERNDRKDNELDSCTFKPRINHRRTRPHSNSVATVLEKPVLYGEIHKSSDLEYQAISPSKKSLCFSTGFNFNQFIHKAHPFVQYKNFSINKWK